MRCCRVCAFGKLYGFHPHLWSHRPRLGPWPRLQGCPSPYFADAARGPRRLMRVGLALILVGHVNLLVGAVLHGTVLRHVANPRGAVTTEYTTANVISVGSGLLVSVAEGGQARRVGLGAESQ